MTKKVIVENGRSNLLARQEWGLAKALTLLSYIVGFFFFFPRWVLYHHLDELIWKSHDLQKSQQNEKAKNQHKAKVEQGSGRWRMLPQCAYSTSATRATRTLHDQRRWQPMSERRVGCCILSPGNSWKVSWKDNSTTSLCKNFKLENLS